MIWDSLLLWNKSKLYLRRAFEAGRESDLFPIWATLSMEFLGRAVLSKINPCLVADPQTGENLLFACGYDHVTSRPKSAPAKTIFLRIKAITENFTDSDYAFVMALMERRNEELHSGASPFESLPNNRWLPDFYRVCKLLTDAHEFSFEELYGPDEAVIASRVIKELEEDRTAAVKKRIAAYKVTFDELGDAELKEKQEEANTVYLVARGPKKIAECPACSSASLITGEEVGASDPVLIDDEVCEEITIIPTSMSCSVCGLHLSGLCELHAAELDDQFVVRHCTPVTEYYEFEGRDTYYEPEYMNS